MHFLSTFFFKVHYNNFSRVVSSQKFLGPFSKDLIYIYCWLTCFPCEAFIAQSEDNFTFSAFEYF